MRFDEIGADLYSYNVTQRNYSAEVLGNDIVDFTDEKSTLQLTLLYYGKDGDVRFYERFEQLKKVTFKGVNRQYDCNLISVDEFGLSAEVWTIVMTYKCSIYGGNYRVEVPTNLLPTFDLYINSKIPTPIKLTIEGSGKITINHMTFTVAKSPVVIDSLNGTITGVSSWDFYKFLHLANKSTITTSGKITKLLMEYRTAYVN